MTGWKIPTSWVDVFLLLKMVDFPWFSEAVTSSVFSNELHINTIENQHTEKTIAFSTDSFKFNSKSLLKNDGWKPIFSFSDGNFQG